ncbi:MAG: MerR family transcriptional regulator [Bacillota bacterium]
MYNIGEVIQIGELKQYKIGEVAELAGISKRTIDYYTNLGLLRPVRSESNYRYYSEDTIVRLRIIENMKENRFTLDEIKEQFAILDDRLSQAKKYNEGGMLNTGFLINQVKLLENQITQLQPVLANIDSGQVALSVKQKLFHSIALLQAILIYIDEIASLM